MTNEIKVLKDRWKDNDEIVEDFCNLLSKPEEFEERFEDFLYMSNDNKLFDFRGIEVSNKNLSGAFFVDIDLSHSTFISCEVRNTAFHSSILNGVEFESLNFERGGIFNCEISSVKFTNTNIDDYIMSGLNFRECLLKNSNFSHADLSSCKFESVKFEDSSLHKAIMPTTYKSEEFWKGKYDEIILWGK